MTRAGELDFFRDRSTPHPFLLPQGEKGRLRGAGMPRVELLMALGRYKVFPFEAELRELEAGNG